MRKTILSLLVLVLSTGVLLISTPAGAADQRVQEADAAARTWLGAVDTGDYGKSWDESAELFKGRIGKRDWEKMLRGARRPLGDLKSRKIMSAQYLTSVPGAPDGEYVVIQYGAAFAKKDAAVETVTPMRQADGSWRVSGYYIR